MAKGCSVVDCTSKNRSYKKNLSFFKEDKREKSLFTEKNAWLALFLFQNINKFCLDWVKSDKQRDFIFHGRAANTECAIIITDIFFSVPDDFKTIWTRRNGLLWNEVKTTYICSLHFVSKCFSARKRINFETA